MREFFKGWRRKAGCITLVLVMGLLCFKWCLGFPLGTAQTSNGFRGGNITIQYPMYPFTPSSFQSDGDAGRVRMDWGRGEGLAINIEHSRIVLNGKDYGSFQDGDNVFINAVDGIFVIVGGENRAPRNMNAN